MYSIPSEMHIKKQSSILTLDSEQILIIFPPPTHTSLLQHPVSYPSIDVKKIISSTNHNTPHSLTSLEAYAELEGFSFHKEISPSLLCPPSSSFYKKQVYHYSFKTSLSLLPFIHITLKAPFLVPFGYTISTNINKVSGHTLDYRTNISTSGTVTHWKSIYKLGGSVTISKSNIASAVIK